ncbi:MAG TPA: flagellar basal body-associated FliL family protein [Chroococcales cyanobacterium]|jgi:flagellar FliL protein
MASKENKQPPSTVALIAIGCAIAAVSAASSFVAIRYAMPRQIIVEKVDGEKEQVKEKKNEATVQYPIGEFIVNLSDPGGRRYLRTSITLEMEEKKKAGIETGVACGWGSGASGGGEGERVAEGEGGKKAGPPAYEPIYKDVIIGAISRKTVSEISTVSGKERLKDELREMLNQRVPDELVVAVYFTDFVIQ